MQRRLPNLTDDGPLESSPVVANSTMNRERGCLGGNSYSKELSFDPLNFLRVRLRERGRAAWLDLCCGRGRALIEAACALAEEGWGGSVELIGVDLVPMFDPAPAGLSFLRLEEAAVSNWQPPSSFDLITCVHGMHYVGDKLKLIADAVSWLEADGVFLSNLDLQSIKLPRGEGATRGVAKALRGGGVEYDARRRLLVCRGRKTLRLDYEYLGANDNAGPNYTGQPAVDSYYCSVASPRRTASQ